MTHHEYDNDELKIQLVEERDRSMSYTKQIGELKSECAVLEERIDEMKATAFAKSNTIKHLKIKYDEAKTNMALMTDEIEFYTQAYDRLRKYPFEEGDVYYVLNQLDFTWIESVWDDESELLHDNAKLPDHPHKVYFTLDQKNIIDNLRKSLES